MSRRSSNAAGQAARCTPRVEKMDRREEAEVRFRIHAAVALAAFVALSALSTVIVRAQKVSTPEELDKVMKGVGKANQTMQKALTSGAYADVRTQITAVRQGVLDSQNFWIEKKRDDAVKFNKETLAKIDEFQKLVATDTVDAAGAAAALKAVGASCRSCHQVYRTTDADDNFILKPGSLEK
jgi:cytochrome c556